MIQERFQKSGVEIHGQETWDIPRGGSKPMATQRNSIQSIWPDYVDDAHVGGSCPIEAYAQGFC